MQQHTDTQGRRILVAANVEDTSYAPSTIRLGGTYVAMIFRRKPCPNPLDIRKT